MYGTSLEWEYVAQERMAEYRRRADRQRLLAQAPSASHTTVLVAFAHRIYKLAAHIIRQRGKTSSVPGTPQAVSGEHIHIVTS
jgi:hypothetical protein